ncbi:MAG: efflux RND transporter permease subunit [Cyclobacteriaceae bacterium]
MLRFLLLRPIAVIMVLIACLAISALAFFQLPVSLLPTMDVPEITISVQYPNSPPEAIEQNVLKPIRESMFTLNGLKSVESVARQENGSISVRLQYGTDMNLAYIEANEKIDRLTSSLPANLERPQVVKTNTSDIPMVRIQVIPAREEDHLAVSELVLNVLKRRLEQLDGIGLVDVNGTRQKIIRIAPDYPVLRSLHLTESAITQTIAGANLELGSLAVHDGNYRYFLKMTSRLTDPAMLESLPINIPGSQSVIRLGQVATVYAESEKPMGFHLFNTREGIVITVHKQAQARMPDVMPRIYSVVDQFKSEYPTLSFQVTQDQSQLLTYSIQNLSQALIWGGLFAFAILFLFMGGWREPVVMGIVLPVSLILCFALLHTFNLSLNIISLSGLALGLGMLVDNSIVVIDNIVLKRKLGLSLLESCVQGTHEVMAPLISSALTNLAVFIPLVFMSGITGALFIDQAIAVTSILFVSILCTFIFVPLLYKLLNKNRDLHQQEDSRFFLWMKKKYHQSFLWVWTHKGVSLTLMALLIPVCVLLLITLPKEGFPEIERTETLIDIDWNEPIEVEESKKRIIQFIEKHRAYIIEAETEVGYQQFILSGSQRSVQQAQVYVKFENEEKKQLADASMKRYFSSLYPAAATTFSNAPNAFEQLFISRTPLYEIRVRDVKSKQPLPLELADKLVQQGKTKRGNGFETETMVFIKLDFMKMRLYGIAFEDLNRKLKIVFGDYPITEFKNFGNVLPVVFEGTTSDFETAVRTTEVSSANGESYPLREFITPQYERSYQNITADEAGIFQSLLVEEVTQESLLREQWKTIAKENNLSVDFTGTWFEKQENLQQLLVILIISFLLMYFIITAEFESFTQPLIVMLSMPLGFAGSLLLLWATGGTINIMSGIGLVVVMGILDNDAILKIDRINSLRKSLPLQQAIEQAGLDRLKPIVMNTCTNVLALTPILFSSGLGADLQRPIAVTTIGGLIVATFAALYFVPLVYWLTSRKEDTEKNRAES